MQYEKRKGIFVDAIITRLKKLCQSDDIVMREISIYFRRRILQRR